VLLYAIPNGASLAGGKRERAIQMSRLKAEGLRPGVPDVCLPCPRNGYGALYIEHKTTTGRISDNQSAWVDRLRAAGNLVVVSRSFEQSRAALLSYLQS